MTPEILFYHLVSELGIKLTLAEGARALEVDAPAGALTPELVGLLREHKAALVELAYAHEERAAIIEEGCDGERRVTFEGDVVLIEQARTHDGVRELKRLLRRLGGGVIEVTRRGVAAT